MPVFVVENRAHGNRAHVTINEGLGKVLRYGANDASVIARLNWLAQEAGPLLGAALRASSGIELRPLMAQALRMGDEMHQRNVAASSLFARALMPHVARVADRHHAVARLAEFLAAHDQFFLNLAMAAGKAMADPASGVAGSTLVTTMARNGTDFGIRVSGLRRALVHRARRDAGRPLLPRLRPRATRTRTWATARSSRRSGSAAARWPPRPRWRASSARAAWRKRSRRPRRSARSATPSTRTSASRRSTSAARRRASTSCRVVETGITPLINTGIASKVAGVGQVGAGVVRAPLGCFTAALEALDTTP